MLAKRSRRSSPASDERRAGILAAALACFTERGFAAASMEEIRRRSGASTGSIYHHFAGKEQLAAALYVEGLRSYQTQVLAALRRQRTPRGGIRAIVDAHLAWVEEHPDWAAYLLQAGQAELAEETGPEIREMNRALLAEVAAWLDPHVRSGAVVRLAPELYAAIVIGPSQTFLRQWLAGRDPGAMARARRELAEAAWRSLRRTEGDR